MLGPGDQAPDFGLTDLAGNPFSLRETLGSGAVAIVFFKVSCPTCQCALPYFERLFAAQKPEAPALVAISQDDAAETEKFRRRFRLSFPMLVDPKPWRTSNLFKITHVPSVFLIEPDGTISAAFDGFVKRGIEQLAERFGTAPFREGESIPGNRPG